MNRIILLIAVMVVSACGKGKEAQTKTKVTEPVKELTLEEKVVGEYEITIDGNTARLVLLKNGIAESYLNGTKIERIGNWIISKEGELYIQFYPSTDVYRINKDGSLTEIATAHVDGTIKDKPKEYQETYKKIK